MLNFSPGGIIELSRDYALQKEPEPNVLLLPIVRCRLVCTFSLFMFFSSPGSSLRRRGRGRSPRPFFRLESSVRPEKLFNKITGRQFACVLPPRESVWERHKKSGKKTGDAAIPRAGRGDGSRTLEEVNVTAETWTAYQNRSLFFTSFFFSFCFHEGTEIRKYFISRDGRHFFCLFPLFRGGQITRRKGPFIGTERKKIWLLPIWKESQKEDHYS